MPSRDLTWRKVEAGVYAAVIGDDVVCVISKDGSSWRLDDPNQPGAGPIATFKTLKEGKERVSAQRIGR